MQSRRDQVNAQRYLTSRLTCALVRAEPDALEPPTRRDVRGLIAGIVVAVLMLGGVAGWALLSSRGSTAWRQPGSLIVDKTSGTRFLFLDGVLRPVRNVASARLLVNGAVKPVVVPGNRLAGVPRGEPLGIEGGPEVLPGSERLNQGVWRACAGDGDGGGDDGDGSGAAITLDIGSPPSRTRVGEDEGLLVSSEGRNYLLWRGQRLLLARPWAADVLGWGDVTPVAVPAAWVELLPAGPDLAPVPVPGRGLPGPAVGGRPTTLGQLFAASTAGGPTVHYLLLASGLTPLTATQLALVQAEAGRADARAITAADLAAARRSVMPEPQNTLPARPPTIVRPAGAAAVCVESEGVPAVAAADATGAGGSGGPGESAGSGGPGESGGSGLPGESRGSGGSAEPGGDGGSTRSAGLDETVLDLVLATRPPAPAAPSPSGAAVQVRSGGGALLVPDADVPAKDQPGLLVDGGGTAFPLTAGALKALGYQPEQAVALPRQLPPLLLRGPLLYTPEGR